MKFFNAVLSVAMATLTLIGCGGAHSTATPAAPVPDKFAAVSNMSTPRIWHTANEVRPGVVAIIGGWDGAKGLSSIELFDKKTGKFTLVGNMPITLYQHAALLIDEQTLLVTGGAGGDSYMSCRSFLVDTNSWSVHEIDRMNEYRQGHSMTMLTDGNVVIIGGESYSNAPSEMFNKYSRNFTSVGRTSCLRREHSAVRIGDNEVFVTGGYSETEYSEVFSRWQNGFANMPGRIEQQLGQQATLLADGRVLLTGMFNHVRLFDPKTGYAESLKDMTVPRMQHTATLLADGRVLLVGSWSIDYTNAEIIDPKLGSDVSTQPVSKHQMHTATRLADGTVFIAGGTEQLTYEKTEITAKAEIFTPGHK